MGLEHVGRHVGREADHRPDGQIDVAGEHDERLADRHQRVHGGVAEDEADVRAARKLDWISVVTTTNRARIADDPEGPRAQDEVDQAAGVGEGPAAAECAPVAGVVGVVALIAAHRPRRRAVAWRDLRRSGGDDRLLGGLVARASRRPRRPSRMTRMRSARSSTSGSSEEITRTATPSAGQRGRAAGGPPPWCRRRCRASARRRSAARGPGQPLGRARPSAGCRRRAVETGSLRPPVLDLQPLRPVGAEAALGAARRSARGRRRLQRGQRDVARRSTSSITSPCWRRSSGTKPIPASIAAVGRAPPQHAARDHHRAGVVAVDAEDRSRHLAAARRRPARPARRSRRRGPRRRCRRTRPRG